MHSMNFLQRSVPSIHSSSPFIISPCMVSTCLCKTYRRMKSYAQRINTVERRLSKLMWGEKCSDNRKVRKIEHPYIYIHSFAQLLQ